MNNSINTLMRIFDDNVTDPFGHNVKTNCRKSLSDRLNSVPQNCIHTENDTTTIEVELPGVNKDSVKVLLEDRILTVKFKKKSLEEEINFKLFYDFKQEDVSATLSDGLLVRQGLYIFERQFQNSFEHFSNRPYAPRSL